MTNVLLFLVFLVLGAIGYLIYKIGIELRDFKLLFRALLDEKFIKEVKRLIALVNKVRIVKDGDGDY